jgi:MFS family permease
MSQPSPYAQTALWRDGRAIALLMAATLTTMANATISPALPGLKRLFESDPWAEVLTPMLVTAPSFSVVLCAPFVGLAADRFGRRGLLLSGVVLFVLAGSAGTLLPGLAAILASRLALGVAVAMVMTAQTALVGDYFTGARRDALNGLQIAARNFGGFVFIALAGWLAGLSPRLPFAVYGLAILFLPVLWMAITEPPRTASAIGGQASAGDGRPAWRRLLAALALLQMATNLLFFLIPTQLPFFLDHLGRDSAALTGAAIGTLMLTGGAAALAYGRLARAIGYRGAYVTGYAAMAAGFALLAIGNAGPTIFAGAALIGAGYATVMPNFVALALALAPARRAGLAGGILTASVFLGQFLSPLASLPAIAALGHGGTFGAVALLLSAMALAATAAARG